MKTTDNPTLPKRLQASALSFLGGIWVGIVLVMIYLHVSARTMTLQEIGFGVLGVMFFCALLGFYKPKVTIKVLFFITLFQ